MGSKRPFTPGADGSGGAGGSQLPGKMPVMVVDAPGQARLDWWDVPTCGPGELLVRITACGICGSDLMDWYVAQKAPLVLGHEPAGVVAGVGEGVEGFQVGDRVFVHHHAPCGDCVFCRTGRWVHCPVWRQPAIEPGGMSGFVRVFPHGVRGDTLRLPPSVSDLDATLVEPVACAVKALDRAGLQPGEEVLIIGLGFMGQILGVLARHRGARRVIGSDLVEERRRLAASWADAVFHPTDLPAGVKSGPDEIGPDLVIITPPSKEAIAQGLECAAPGGRVLLYAPLATGELMPLALGELFFREVDIISSYSAGPTDTRTALSLIQQGIVTAGQWPIEIFPITRAAEAYRRAQDPGAFKVIVTMDWQPV